MRSYQLEGFTWITQLWENGLSGILADEMGLGKTVMTIAFLAHLWSKGVRGPFIIVAPLSTLQNWKNEFSRYANYFSAFCLQYFIILVVMPETVLLLLQMDT